MKVSNIPYKRGSRFNKIGMWIMWIFYVIVIIQVVYAIFSNYILNVIIWSVHIVSKMDSKMKDTMIKSEKLLKIYKVVRMKPKPKYKPVRKHYNTHLFG